MQSYYYICICTLYDIFPIARIVRVCDIHMSIVDMPTAHMWTVAPPRHSLPRQYFMGMLSKHAPYATNHHKYHEVATMTVCVCLCVSVALQLHVMAVPGICSSKNKTTKKTKMRWFNSMCAYASFGFVMFFFYIYIVKRAWHSHESALGHVHSTNSILTITKMCEARIFFLSSFRNFYYFCLFFMCIKQYAFVLSMFCAYFFFVSLTTREKNIQFVSICFSFVSTKQKTSLLAVIHTCGRGRYANWHSKMCVLERTAGQINGIDALLPKIIFILFTFDVCILNFFFLVCFTISFISTQSKHRTKYKILLE